MTLIRTCRGILLLSLLGGCGDSGSSGDNLPPPLCPVQTGDWPSEGQYHAPIGSPLTFNTNPPSSGTHYPIWGHYDTHAMPLDRGYYVHNMEHGGVVLLYRCDGGCPDIVAGLQAVIDGHQPDPACSAPVRARLVLTPDPLLDVPVATAAWQHTYKAQCVDAPSLSAFINAHYDQAPESTCLDGSVE